VAWPQARTGSKTHPDLFKTSDQCLACHNGLKTPAGEDVSIGANWRASMMANSSRDPYWQAAVRRETVDHPESAAAIQDECATCHMPMARTEARAGGRSGTVFDHLPVASQPGRADRLAHDGVSCTICHQITDKNLGTPSSFTGGYVVDLSTSSSRAMFGPFQIEKGITSIMRSSTGFQPTEATHIRDSELCATCHTLITKSLGPGGAVTGELPEQVMYLEWRHSVFDSQKKSCQSCHMPVVEEDTPISSVLGAPRKGFSKHTFIGGNFFMLNMLDRYRDQLGVSALPAELAASARATVRNLQTATARLALDRLERAGNRLTFELAVQNLTGHKLPTGYPARRAWLHVIVRDAEGRVVFESGAIAPDGSIQASDGDRDASAVEPHYLEITSPEQVQIYESVMSDSAGRPTTGLLSAVRYLKDNRLLPDGFDKVSADPRIAVVGGASNDADFTGGGDRVRYSVPLNNDGALEVTAELRFQTIGYRWAENLKQYDTAESRRFGTYYGEMASGSSEILATVSSRVSP
jgi:hypothetical protein